MEIDKRDTNSDTNIIVGVIYRRPGSDVKIFNEILDSNLTKIKNEKKYCFHGGDYNLDLLKSDTHSPTGEFIAINFAYSFIPLICKPTRVTTSSATIIDNIFSNKIEDTQTTTGIIISDLTDHFPIFFIKHKITVSTNTPEYKLKRSINENSKMNFKTDLTNVNWSPIINESCAQKSYSMFHDILTEKFEKHFPIKKVKIGYQNKLPWITQGVKKSICIKHKLYTKYLKNPSINNLSIYKSYKNKLYHILRIQGRKHFQDQLKSCQNNLRKS